MNQPSYPPTMIYEYVDVNDGDIRLRCYSTDEVDAWIKMIINKGGVPKLEMGPRKERFL